MSFEAPLLLLGLALVPLAAAAYVLAQRRRRRYAVRYTNVDLLASVASRGWGRHLPALLGLLALAALLIAVARPERTVAADRREATVMLVTDTSGSMQATDVRPTRLAAAQAAARDFLAKVPPDFRVGIVSFGTRAEQLLGPTTDRQQALAVINRLKVAGTTAMGDGLTLGLDAARTPVPDGLGGSRRLPAALVLLSDGESLRGADPIDVAQRARKLGIRVYAVALGTRSGTLTQDGKTVPVPPDTLTLQDIARDTGGQFFAAPSAQQLRAVYANLGTRLSKVPEKQQVTSAFAGGALVLLLAGMGAALLRGGRLP